MTAPCGLACFHCWFYGFTKKDFLEMTRKHMAENEDARSKLSPLEPLKQYACKGCRNENGQIPILGKKPCRVYRCVEEKNIKFCYECSDFPCDYLHPYADNAREAPHNTKVFNLCLIKKMGLEAWAKNKAKSVKDTYFYEEFKL